MMFRGALAVVLATATLSSPALSQASIDSQGVVSIQVLRPITWKNATTGSSQFGPVLLSVDPAGAPSSAVYQFVLPQGGRYRLRIRYAAASPRPIRVSVNQQLIKDNVLQQATGCWEFSCQKWEDVGEVVVKQDANSISLDRDNHFPHISAIEFIPIRDSDVAPKPSASSPGVTSPTQQKSTATATPAPAVPASPATALPQPASFDDPLDKLAYEAFCQNNEQQIASVAATVASARALDLSYKALINCPGRNTGPFWAAGSFWNKPTATTTTEFFFKTAGFNFRSTPIIWQTIPVYVPGNPTKLFGRDYRPFKRVGTRTVLLPYSPFVHALNSFGWQFAESTSFAGAVGSPPDKQMAFSEANLRSIVTMLPDKFPPTSPFSAKYDHPFDVHNCVGLTALASSVLAQRYAAVNGLLDRNADVNGEVAALTEEQGVPLEFLELANFNGDRNSPLMVLKKEVSCFELRANGPTVYLPSDIMQAYRNISGSLPFFDYFLLLYKDKPGAKEAFRKIVDRVVKVSPGVLPFLVSSPQFDIDLRQPEGQEIVKRLIAKGADINAKDANGNTSLKILMNNAIAREVYQFMVSLGAQL